jgi:hypothetical protein
MWNTEDTVCHCISRNKIFFQAIVCNCVLIACTPGIGTNQQKTSLISKFLHLTKTQYVLLKEQFHELDICLKV